jgi:hypothetical protein
MAEQAVIAGGGAGANPPPAGEKINTPGRSTSRTITDTVVGALMLSLRCLALFLHTQHPDFDLNL